MADDLTCPISAVGADPRHELVYAAQQCADAASQMLMHHIQSGMIIDKVRFDDELVDRLAEALRTACEVEAEALLEQRGKSRVFEVSAIDEERSDLGQLAAACSKFLLRGAAS